MSSNISTLNLQQICSISKLKQIRFFVQCEDRVTWDNGFGRNTTYWTFCYCFYSRILFSCGSVTLFMWFIDKMNLSQHRGIQGYKRCTDRVSFFVATKNSRDLPGEITLTLLTDRSIPFIGQKIMRLLTHVNVLRNHLINFFSLYAEKRTSVSHCIQPRNYT